MTKTNSLFDEQEISASPSENFLGRARGLVVDQAAVCRALYEEWKKLYRSFRDLEKQYLYAPPAGTATLKAPDEGSLRAHRHSIAVLTQRGEELAALFDQIASSAAANQKDALHELKFQVGILLESLRESMELWHPANKPNCPNELKNIFER